MRVFVILLASTALLILIFKIVLLPGSRGGISEFIKGQFNSSPKNIPLDITIEGGKSNPYNIEVFINLDKPVFEVSDKYLSFAIDVSSVVGGKWWDPNADGIELKSGSVKTHPLDFSNSKFNKLTRNLAPAYLRIGGSESDKIYYDLNSEKLFADDVPLGYESVLTKNRWKEVNNFTKQNNLELSFTLNAGPSSRNKDGKWDSKNSEELITYSKNQNLDINVWELGNELNFYWYIFGLGNVVSPKAFSSDISDARKLLKSHYPNSYFNGQGSGYWPVLGEPLPTFFKFTKEYLKLSGKDIDKILWHYYPQQSRRGPVASRRANPYRLLDPSYLDEAAHWANQIISWRDQFAPGKAIWMGETGNAQFGGEPGVSDVYISGLWWLDQLGILALNQTEVVIRQSLIGLNYGLIEGSTLKLRPDYWNSILWKKLMGEKVFEVNKKGNNSEKLRVYAHSSSYKEESFITILAINLDYKKNAMLELPELKGHKYEIFSITTNNILSDELLLNGKILKLDQNNNLPEIEGILSRPEYTPFINISPLSYAFIVFYK